MSDPGWLDDAEEWFREMGWLPPEQARTLIDAAQALMPLGDLYVKPDKPWTAEWDRLGQVLQEIKK